MRQIIETQAACLAARRRNTADIKRLHHLNQQFETGLHSDDLAFQTNRDFHIAIVETAKNPLMTEVMTPILTATMEVYISARQQSLAQNRNLKRFVEEHRQIIDAIEQQETELTTRLMTDHIDGARMRVQQIMDNRED